MEKALCIIMFTYPYNSSARNDTNNFLSHAFSFVDLAIQFYSLIYRLS